MKILNRLLIYFCLQNLADYKKIETRKITNNKMTRQKTNYILGRMSRNELLAVYGIPFFCIIRRILFFLLPNNTLTMNVRQPLLKDISD